MDPRPYQRTGLDTLLNNNAPLKRAVIPTGGGKTLIESLFLNKQLSFSGSKIHLVLAPRIALSINLSKTTVILLVKVM